MRKHRILPFQWPRMQTGALRGGELGEPLGEAQRVAAQAAERKGANRHESICLTCEIGREKRLIS